MAIPLLNYAPKTQNARVAGEVPADDQPRIYSAETLLSGSDMDDLIEAGYRQIFFHAFKSDREPFLESQLRSGQITVRDFVRGLLLSDTYNRSFYNLNSNYRFVEHCVQRVLGRDIHGEGEKLAWSIVVATKGREGFIDDLLNSDEYLDNFGYDILPYQRRRVLPGRATGETPFNIQTPRYNEYYRTILGFPKMVYMGSVKSIPKRIPVAPGNPDDYLELARSVQVGPRPGGAVALESMDYMKKVPYRREIEAA